MAITRIYAKELLQPIVAVATSVAGVLRLLGLRPNGGSHAHLSRTIKRFQIDTSHFERYPSTVPPVNRRTAAQILVRRPPDHRREKPHVLRRALL